MFSVGIYDLTGAVSIRLFSPLSKLTQADAKNVGLRLVRSEPPCIRLVPEQYESSHG